MFTVIHGRNAFVVLRAVFGLIVGCGLVLRPGVAAAQDKTGPTFANPNVTITGATATSLTVSWTAARDDVSAPSTLTYHVCRSTSSAECGGSRFVATATVSAGKTTVRLEGLAASTTYYVLVRAVDQAGNFSTTTTLASAATLGAPDSVAPTFDGVVTRSGATATSLTMSWVAATDNLSPASALVYQVCRSVTATGCETAFTAAVTTPAGATTAVLNGLNPGTTHYIVVRVRDQAGNLKTNPTVVQAATVADTVAPVFGGGVTVTNATTTSLSVSWPAAGDNVTPASALVYHLCRSTSSTGCNPFANALVTTPGATTAVLTGLVPNTTYFLAIRVMDQAGNVTTNATVVQARTLAATSDETPSPISFPATMKPNGGV